MYLEEMIEGFHSIDFETGRVVTIENETFTLDDDELKMIWTAYWLKYGEQW